MTILKDASKQFIDKTGKLRLVEIKWKDNIIHVSVSPQIPKSLPLVKQVIRCDVKDAQDFIQGNEGELVSQHVDSVTGRVFGLWCNFLPHITYAYIPVEPRAQLANITTTSVIDPITYSLEHHKSSKLEEFRRMKKLGEYLKEYTLFLYASVGKDEFNDELFEIVEDHKYEIGEHVKKLSFKSSFFTKDNKLIVPNEETKKNLLSYLNVELLNDTAGVLSTRCVLKPKYESAIDFSHNDDQYVFTSRESLQKWYSEIAYEKQMGEDLSPYRIPKRSIDSQRTHPYYLSLVNLSTYLSDKKIGHDSDVFLVQNPSNPTLENALAICAYWEREGKVPIDLDGLPPVVNHSYVLVSVYSEQKVKEMFVSRGKPFFILDYENNTYGAILFEV